MANLNSTIMLKFEDQTITLPSLVVTRMLEKIFNDTPRVEQAAAAAPVHASAPFNLPAIGEPYEGGIYAGLTLLGNRVKALVLLPGDEELKWKDAIAWAEKQDGVLPSRVDALILWQNLPNEFKKEAYWTGTQLAASSGYAWYQNFGYGGQLINDIRYKLRARSVRRLEI